MRLQPLRQFLFGTLRGRLIVSVATVHAVMMALFVTDLTVRQRAMILDRQTEQATALSRALATSAAAWIAADDISGMQELVESQRRYPELVFALLADRDGRILAHSDRTKQGLYLRDLPVEGRHAIISRSPALVDAATPALLSGRQVGWARVGIGQKGARERLARVTLNGVIYAVAAIVAGSLIAWLMGGRISRRLYGILETINRVRTGEPRARATLTGDDEAANLAHEFNAMLDRLDERDGEIRASEQRYRMVFEHSPVSIWEEDFSAVKALFAGLKEAGITDIEQYFEQHPETVQRCAGLARIVDVNRAALALHGAGSKEELLDGLVNTFTPESFTVFRQELICLWKGETEMTRDAEVRNLAGEPRQVTVYFSVCPGYEETLAKVIVSLADITERKRSEELLRQSEEAVRLREGLLNESQRVGQVGGWDWDAKSDVIWWSEEYYRIYGFEPGTPPPNYQDHLQAYTPESAARLDAVVKRAMESGEPYEIDLELANPTPTTRWVVARCEVKRDENGSITGLRGTAHNITERKLAEQQLQALNEQLELRVKERTAELEEKNAELEQMNKLFVGRELRMAELKERIRELEEKLSPTSFPGGPR